MSTAKPQVKTVEREITADLIEAFAEVSGDDNPLHLDEEAAEDGPFGERVAHGMLGASLISAALADLDGDVVYLDQELTFEAPVFIGDTLTAEVTPGLVVGGDSTKVSTNVVNQDDELVISGVATVMIHQEERLNVKT